MTINVIVIFWPQLLNTNYSQFIWSSLFSTNTKPTDILFRVGF